MPFHPNPSLRRIAAHCGVARATVGFILGGQAHKFRPEMRERVLAAAEELGWRPLPGQMVVRTGRFGCAVLLQSQIGERSVLRPGLLDALEEELLARDMHLTLARLPDEALVSEACVKQLLQQWSADGILINYTHRVPERLQAQIDRLEVPAVWLNIDSGLDTVRPDDEAAGYVAGRLLIDRGHQRILYVDLPRPREWDDELLHGSVVARRRGCQRAVEEVGFTFRCLHYGHGEAQMAIARAWLEAPDRPTAVVAFGPTALLPLIHVALSMGLQIPDDLSVVTFNDEPWWVLDRSVTTLCLPYAGMAEAAVSHLVERIAGQPSRSLDPVAFELVSGETVTRPASAKG